MSGELPRQSAHDLRARGLTLRQIAAELGVTVRQVRKDLDPDRVRREEREQNRRRNAAKREWERRAENLPECEVCGGPASRSAQHGICVRCLVAGRTFRRAWQRDLRAGGALNTEIADIVGLIPEVVVRDIGPGSPYVPLGAILGATGDV